MPRDSLCNGPSVPIVAWVKYGLTVTIAEALTQNWAARALSAHPAASVPVRAPRVFDAFSTPMPNKFIPDLEVGYIVMEYIDAPDCDDQDIKLVAKAVQTLISIPGPGAPGPVGGGRIIHTFFDEWGSPITYETVEELQMHINGILKFMGDKRRVDLVADAHAGLRLCPCDFTSKHFKKCPDGTVVALNFQVTCLLPPSFFAVAMMRAQSTFTRNVARSVDYPKSDGAKAMVSAAWFLVRVNNTGIGETDSLSFNLKCFHDPTGLPRELGKCKGLS